MRVLVVEDDLETAQFLRKALKESGHAVVLAHDGEEGAALAREGSFDVMIIDRMLPKLDGLSLVRQLRSEGIRTPVLILSALGEVDDKVKGLRAGGDDYLTKPFHPEELEARIRVLLRRFGTFASEPVAIKHLLFYENENRLVNRDTGEEIVLTGKQFQIFTYMVRHLGQILTKEQIFEAVWGEPYLEGDKTLMVHIRHLREKVERDPNAPEVIETVRGIGYRVRA